ncbi:MAG: OB-fold domain-containing protein [Acidimicrobiia bacterium]
MSAGPAVAQRLIADDILTSSGDDARLIGSRCADCGTTTFPASTGCPKCSGEQMEETPLPRRGTLWTFTTQSFPVKDPYIGPSGDDFVPFGVGYVQLSDDENGDVVKVEGRLTEPDPSKLTIGMEMELTVVPFAGDPDGTDVLTYAFRPCGQQETAS